MPGRNTAVVCYVCLVMFGVEDGEEEGPGAVPVAPEAGRDRGISPRIDELIERIERPDRRFPIERAILISLGAHLLLLILLLVSPAGRRFSQRENLLAGRESVAEPPVPVRFFVEAPGPERKNSKPEAPLSDKTRRAGGGDRTRPSAPSPYIARRSGIEGLEGGRAGPRGAGGAASNGASTPRAPASPAAGEASERASSGEEPTRPLSGSPPQNAEKGPPDLRKAIAAAAGTPFAGPGGAPRANESGGFVDSGPISFDTQWYDWGDYAAEMVRRIKVNWDVPDLARIGVKGRLTVRFFIRADGTVEREEILRGSTIPPFDHAAFQAIAKSSPFRPLPKELHEDREGVTVTFFYNISPGEENGRR